MYLQRQRVARADVGALAGLEQVADSDSGRGKDVPLLAVEVMEEGDAGVAVRVVLDRRHLGRDAVLVATEVDDPVALLVAASSVTGGLAAVAVTAARA